MKKINGYITYEELKKDLLLLDNAQDKFILLAIYNGIAGKSGLSELINLKVKDVNFKKHIIKVDNREVLMDKEFEKITKEAIEQDVYVSEVVSKHGVEEYELNRDSEYVIRIRPKAVNNWGLSPITYNTLRAKIKKISAKAGFEINASQLETSGIVNRLLSEKKEWTVLDIEFELRMKNIKANAYRIYSIIKEITSYK
ncbi:hypothetical protein ACQPVP_09235 [Clostridium nigeriense]|uniref:hypothetical protein n=1 Tax=Clostridium nigeriense TaxID=1805470 RepID=UPI003D357902